MEKKKKTIGIIATIVIIALLIQFARLEYITKYKITTIESSVSVNGDYELLFQSVGEADMPFGNSHARLVLKNKGKDIIKYKFVVANDGKNLCSDNWKVTWNDDTVDVLIIGEEQKDILYSLTYEGDVQIKPEN